MNQSENKCLFFIEMKQKVGHVKSHWQTFKIYKNFHSSLFECLSLNDKSVLVHLTNVKSFQLKNI